MVGQVRAPERPGLGHVHAHRLQSAEPQGDDRRPVGHRGRAGRPVQRPHDGRPGQDQCEHRSGSDDVPGCEQTRSGEQVETQCRSGQPGGHCRHEQPGGGGRHRHVQRQTAVQHGGGTGHQSQQQQGRQPACHTGEHEEQPQAGRDGPGGGTREASLLRRREAASGRDGSVRPRRHGQQGHDQPSAGCIATAELTRSGSAGSVSDLSPEQDEQDRSPDPRNSGVRAQSRARRASALRTPQVISCSVSWLGVSS